MHAVYHVRLRYESNSPLAKGNAPKKNVYNANIWRSTTNLRTDAFNRSQDTISDLSYTKSRHVICTNCERNNYFIATTIHPGMPVLKSLVEFKPLTSDNPDYYGLDIDWRYFGLGNCAMYGYHHLRIPDNYDDFRVNPRVRVDTELHSGKRCSVTSVEGSGTNRTWFSEPDAGNPIFFEATSESRGLAVRNVTEVEWQKTAGGHYYPSRVTNTQHIDGKMWFEELITVTHADFDTPIDPTVFTLSGLELNDNQKIALPGLTLGQFPHWHNGKVDHSLSDDARIREAGRPDTPGPLAVANPRGAAYPTSDNTLLVVSIASGTLAVVTLATAVVYRRRKGIA